MAKASQRTPHWDTTLISSSDCTYLCTHLAADKLFCLCRNKYPAADKLFCLAQKLFQGDYIESWCKTHTGLEHMSTWQSMSRSMRKEADNFCRKASSSIRAAMGFAMANEEVGLPAMVNCILTGQVSQSLLWFVLILTRGRSSTRKPGNFLSGSWRVVAKKLKERWWRHTQMFCIFRVIQFTRCVTAIKFIVSWPLPSSDPWTKP